MSQSFSFSSLSGTARRGAPEFSATTEFRLPSPTGCWPCLRCHALNGRNVSGLRGRRWIIEGAVEAGTNRGAELIIKAPPEESDVGIQLKYLNYLATQNIEALVIGPTSADALITPVAALAAKGVKIAVVDSPLANNAGDAYVFVGSDHRAAGEAAGRLMATLVGDTDEVAILRHNQTSRSTIERELAFMKKMKEAHPDLSLHADIFAATDAGTERQKAELLLGKYPHSKANLKDPKIQALLSL
jgi:ABC-type sugar transport system substrate-binding protein